MNLPPYISRTPPPINETEDDEDEEFGTFAVCSDLGEEVSDGFDKTSQVIKSEDNVSEDSGFCMNSVGQTQSPCDISPLSSSYNKGNECMNIDNHGDIVLTRSTEEIETCKVENIKLNDTCNHSKVIDDIEKFHSNEVYIDSSESVKMPEQHTTCIFSESSDVVSDKVYFVNKGPDVEYILNNDTVSLTDSFCHDSLDSSYHKPLKDRKNNRYENSKMPVFENNVAITKVSKIFSKNEPRSNEEIKESTSCPIETNSACQKISIFTTLSYNEKNIEYTNNETSIKGEIEVDTDLDLDDEFSDFTGFQLLNSFPKLLKPDSEIQDRSNGCETVQEDPSSIIETLQSTIETNIVWNCLQCFEETPAFKYQWSTSDTQMKFLHALQIDSRNILLGPWSKMNKFNWTDISNTFESSNYNLDCTFNSITTNDKEVIPDAHFDWITSGLINPLQGTSNEKETLRIFEESSASEILITRSRDVLNSLPKLNFLKSTYINFK